MIQVTNCAIQCAIVIDCIQLLFMGSCANDCFVLKWKCVLKPRFLVHQILYLVSPILFVFLNTDCKPFVKCYNTTLNPNIICHSL